jgi:hypothetical protein
LSWDLKTGRRWGLCRSSRHGRGRACAPEGRWAP